VGVAAAIRSHVPPQNQADRTCPHKTKQTMEAPGDASEACIATRLDPPPLCALPCRHLRGAAPPGHQRQRRRRQQLRGRPAPVPGWLAAVRVADGRGAGRQARAPRRAGGGWVRLLLRSTLWDVLLGGSGGGAGRAGGGQGGLPSHRG
jgi:hypothetical protein